MAGIIYTSQRSKLSKKQRAARETLLKEQRAIRQDLKRETSQSIPKFSFVDPTPMRRSTLRPASRDTGLGVATKREPLLYTGDKMIGIGQMHKSNAVPVFRQEDAEDLARMRR